MACKYNLGFDLKVYFTTIGGNHGSFNSTDGSERNQSNMLHDDGPLVGMGTIAGVPGFYPEANTAVTAFGFELLKPESGEIANPLDLDINHLGRYIGTWHFRLQDRSYNSAAGTMSYQYENQVWAPDTVLNSNVKYFTQAVLLQFGADSAKAGKTPAHGSLCIEGSDQLDELTKWKCGDFPQGPEREEHKVSIEAKYWPGRCLCDLYQIKMQCVFPDDNDFCYAACKADSYADGTCSSGL